MGWFGDFLEGKESNESWHFDRSKWGEFYKTFFGDQGRDVRRMNQEQMRMWRGLMKQQRKGGTRARQDLREMNRTAAGNITSGMQQRGLSNTTVRDTMQADRRRDYGREKRRIQDEQLQGMQMLRAQKPIQQDPKNFANLMQALAQTGYFQGPAPQRQGGFMSAFQPQNLGSQMGGMAMQGGMNMLQNMPWDQWINQTFMRGH